MSKILDVIRDWHNNDNQGSFDVIKQIEAIEFDKVQDELKNRKPEPQKQFKYEKVNESFGDVIKMLVDGHTFYSKSGNGNISFTGSDFVNKDGTSVDIACLSTHEFYRKVEIDPVVELAEEIYSIAHKGMDTKALCYLAAKHAIDKPGAK